MQLTGDPSKDRHPYLERLGWSHFFDEQLAADEAGLSPSRVDAVHRSRLTALNETGQVDLVTPTHTDTAAYAVGDWVLVDPISHALGRRLARKTLLQRRGEGKRPAQLVAANIDTLFIVTSCNSDFNIARLERYLALANDAGTEPVIVLTKIDVGPHAEEFEREASKLQRDLSVVALNARSASAVTSLSQWCGVGSTVALIGSSGVGKSTLVNTLVGTSWRPRQETGGIRERDSMGRHTTTSRSLHPMSAGGWVIDTPGIRSLHLAGVGQGIDTLFAEITELAPSCKFRNCTHDHEPSCAVLAAVEAGTLDPERLVRWKKLQAESK